MRLVSHQPFCYPKIKFILDHATRQNIFLKVFILVGAGIVGGIGLIIVEILYHKHKMRRAKRTETAKVAFTRWKGTIEVRFFPMYTS